MLVQLHAQNPKNANQTEMLMQGEVNDEHQAQDWYALCRPKWEALKDQIPEGWIPMVCTQDSVHFVWAAPKQEQA